MQLKDTKLSRLQFLSETDRGRKFESEVQGEIRDISSGEIFNNIRIDHMEFDVIIANFPLLTFVEIKAYRSNLARRRIKEVLIKLVRNCVRVTEDDSLRYRDWVPYEEKAWDKTGNRKWLFRKLGLNVSEGWRFRMILIVPDKSFDGVLSAIEGKRLSSNLLSIESYPLLVIPKRRIREIF